MPTNVWNRTVDLKGAAEKYIANRDWPTYRDAIVTAIEESGWLGDTPYPDTLRDHVNALKACDTAVVAEAYWSAIYDVADEDRVWIETT